MTGQPILLNSCARAATAAEARFRINRTIAPARATRVVALDEAAATVVRRTAEGQWSNARFFTQAAPAPVAEGKRNVADVVLRSVDGSESWLSDELVAVDAAVMVATANDGAAVASAVGDACTLRGIMTAGLVLAHGQDTRLAVAALRPHARVLLVTEDENDVTEVLTALRA
ncbi:3-methyl-2-oxobutanoate hydroxymethyltransferase [Sphaerisporangium album]|uniref:3-methyl-2-oxobutanoate hydroxymethyltransferase n=1 Tax=Sphaerisporangium album TaxID=509200 RepID=A0A367FJY5_9ACTN|nr:3-methyl-2-oxobutanoate hydroxymethyltransferase [Sphaerisporangium album]RCG30686.1 3-methyl-2-oxobutanoate hydroxymethyltransferase [Sphaerisporangium album]